MAKLYSAITGGFYDSAIHGANVPEDAVQLTDSKYKQLMNGQAQGKKITADENGLPILSDPPLPGLYERQKTAKAAIDTSAGNARKRYVSAGHLVEEEYHLALQQTQAWRANGSPDDAVPAAIGDWASAAGMTPEQAATDIEQTAAGWEQVLLVVRNIRLSGKAAVDAAADQGTADDMANVAQPYIDQLDAMAP